MRKTTFADSDSVAAFDDAGVAMGHGAGIGPKTSDQYADDGDPFPLAAGGSASTAAGSNSPVASTATLADWLINGFWQNNGTSAHHWASNTITYNLGNLNAAEQALALSALNAWHDVASINFVQTSGTANINFNHNGTMQAVTNASWNGSGQMISSTIDISTDWVTTDGGANDGKTGVDSYAYQTYLHEIGHALGLGHQGPYNGSASYSTNAIFANDTWQYSIMSYFSEPNYSGSSYRYVITPQMADIDAVALMYGAATTTRTGNTVYGFNNTASSIYNFSSYTQAPALTIYDSGGTDTLDCSGYSSSQTIDLHAGNFSSVGGLKNNIGIALGTVIENAIGGSGGDTLIAGDNGCSLSGLGGIDTLIGGAGADRLTGGTGRDTLTGNGGADTFIFASGDSSAASGQHDRIADFTSADRIDISAMGTFRFLGNGSFDGGTYALTYFYSSSSGLTTLQGDINGDGAADFAIDLTGNITLGASYIIGAQQAPPVVIEATGATSLVQSGGLYYLNPVGGGTGPTLKQSGANFAVGQGGSWTPIAAEKTANGYDVAWKNTSTGQFSIWSTDSNGNYINNSLGVVSATDTNLESKEVGFQQDLNGDGTVGVPSGSPSSAIESFGATSLVQSGGLYYLNPVGGGTGPTLKQSGVNFAVGQAGSWTPIAAEKTANGYDVAWKNTSTGQFSIWSTDSNGNYINNSLGVVSATDTNLESKEVGFQQDLNGDGTFGIPSGSPSSAIESFGATSLVQSGGLYYLNPVGGGTGPTLKQSGANFAVGQAGSWTPIAAEKTANGYDVAWKNTSTGQFSIWSTDSNGNYINNSLGVVSATDTNLESKEVGFQQDLNGDGTIGIPTPAASLSAAALLGAGSDSFFFDFSKLANSVGQLVDVSNVFENTHTLIPQVGNMLGAYIHTLVETTSFEATGKDGHIDLSTGAELLDHTGHFLLR